jgi:hypothetical protein
MEKEKESLKGTVEQLREGKLHSVDPEKLERAIEGIVEALIREDINIVESLLIATRIIEASAIGLSNLCAKDEQSEQNNGE